MRLIEAQGRRAVTMPGDIQGKTFCQQLVQTTVSEFGRIDMLINNAAFQRTHEKLEDIPEDEFETTFRTNVFATFFLTQAAVAK